MASNVVFNGVTYSIPADGDNSWGPDLTAYFISIASNALQKTGGTFTLTAEAAFGATFGLKAPYFKSYGTNPASAGAVRLANTESISFRNNANSADLALTSNASDALLFNSKNVLFSALALIVNADVNAAAAIAYSKLAALTASRVLVSSAGGVVEVSAVTATTLSYLDATSSVQTQMNTKAPSASPTFTGTVTLPATVTGASAQVLTLPTSSATLSTIGLTETLLLKTLTSPQINGVYLANSNKTANYTLVLTDDVVTCDASAGVFTITFPSAATSTRKVFVVKKTDSSFNAVTLSGTGMTTNYLMTVGETVTFQSDGSTWVQIHRKTDTGWISFTPTGAWITNTTYTGYWRRVSDGIEMNVGVLCTGAPTTASLSVNIPNSAGWTITSSKLVSLSTNVFNYGLNTIQDAGTAYYHGAVRLNNTTSVQMTYGITSGANLGHSNVTQAAPVTFGTGDTVDFTTINIPITNFSA